MGKISHYKNNEKQFSHFFDFLVIFISPYYNKSQQNELKRWLKIEINNF